ncbi:hypothetical protein A2617_02655 [Candidatus Daviesbacteria bacterium RIFOXYD1_FULL_41_10]|uniref:Uncharacterized protein n=2 Tax=Candidatus Daviesiibacteriota TaxID=1752718 RepID=A0A1F5N1K8_9BACT|nr:MAG: hypothetical protein UU67_C0029G0020 [Candidatus Daviesbacteria bacterium GW2011_GWB1_41_5]OGE71501.1 MAG: hypothetical protein A2617_02655 [Candidatus Daviesbacteria bacterium RIFOXYD1_FULL_41_10]
MERRNNVISLEPGQTVVIVGVKPAVQIEPMEQANEAIKESMHLIQGNWRTIDGLFFGGDLDEKDSEGALVGKLLPVAKELVKYRVSPDELFRATLATIEGGRDKMLPVERKNDMARKIAGYFFQIAAEEEVKSPKS